MGAYIYNVSDEILACFSTDKKPSVLMLCNLSAIFIRITLTSSFRVNNIFLKFSAWIDNIFSFFSLEILVKPSTILAILFPNFVSI